MKYTASITRARCEIRDFKIFSSQVKNYNLNIVGTRSKNIRAGKFNDTLSVMWSYKDIEHYKEWPITTDPGLYYLKNPFVKSKGTAIMKQGQYRGAYKLAGSSSQFPLKGHGRTNYLCLRQVKPVWFYRDVNRDGILDFNESSLENKVIHANIHRASTNYILEWIGKYSAGCQVFQNYEHYKEFLNLCIESEKRWGNSFTYTLIDLNI